MACWFSSSHKYSLIVSIWMIPTCMCTRRVASPFKTGSRHVSHSLFHDIVLVVTRAMDRVWSWKQSFQLSSLFHVLPRQCFPLQRSHFTWTGGEKMVIVKYYGCLTGKVPLMPTEAHLSITAFLSHLNLNGTPSITTAFLHLDLVWTVALKP